jgi:nucleoside-diphosphate-sugar epimerase
LIAMRVFVAGATGAIGRHLVPRLVAAGHQVTAMTRTPGKVPLVQSWRAVPVVCDALDRPAVRRAVLTASPEVVIHQLTDIPQQLNPRRVSQALASTNRLRTDGARHLIDAAKEAGARRFIAQSVAFAYAPVGGWIKSEDDPLFLDGPMPWKPIVAAVDELERSVLNSGLEGTILRYGQFYGPGTVYAPDGSVSRLVRTRRLPIVGSGGGMASFIHVDDAAAATVAAVERGVRGTYNIVDDEPAPAREWVAALAETLAAPRPLRVPSLIGWLVGGSYVVMLMTQVRGASNQKAKRELGWTPRFATWRGVLGTAS